VSQGESRGVKEVKGSQMESIIGIGKLRVKSSQVDSRGIKCNQGDYRLNFQIV
jgi:hypothetical protein